MQFDLSRYVQQVNLENESESSLELFVHMWGRREKERE